MGDKPRKKDFITERFRDRSLNPQSSRKVPKADLAAREFLGEYEVWPLPHGELLMVKNVKPDGRVLLSGPFPFPPDVMIKIKTVPYRVLWSRNNMTRARPMFPQEVALHDQGIDPWRAYIEPALAQKIKEESL